ncbi:AraC family transcriptional regulator [Flavobacterium faecale]|uniref:AraC family transcriptional regulator n=1 Tax=Flavobacterium faecale TaxID=1355330 RepID=A0A2S1LIB2_9FLAO|nr:helix-turn-helix domain-containing protein [Flavobacterium faecale]AWG23525.1 AraC family transcriptional regulator [Flavobacterium faecale]
MKKYPVYSIQQFNCNSVQADFYVNTFQKHLVTHPFVEKPHRHNFYVMAFFTKGSGTHEIDFDSYSVAPGSVFVLQPGQMHHWSLSEDIGGYVLFYSQEMYNLYFGEKEIDIFPFFYSNDTKSEIILTKQEMESLQPFFDLIFKESQSDELFKKDKIMNLLDLIHIELARKYQETFASEVHAYNSKLKMFAKVLESHFKTEKAASFYANALHISLKHLNRICNETVNKTTTEIITNRIVLEAKRMLMDKNSLVSEIALELGYDDYSYFARFFKKNTGMSPKDFRLSK